jgi:hypothetical protein
MSPNNRLYATAEVGKGKVKEKVLKNLNINP